MTSTKKSSPFNRLKDVFKFAWKYCRKLLVISIIYGILSSFVPYIAIYCSQLIINNIYLEHYDLVMTIVWWMVSLTLFFGLISNGLDKYLNSLSDSTRVSLSSFISKKIYSLSYKQIEDNETMKLIKEADEGSNGSGDIVSFCREYVAEVFSNIGTIIYGLVLVIPIFLETSNVSPVDEFSSFLANPSSFLIIIAIMILSIIGSLLLTNAINAFSYKTMMNNVEGNRQFSYYYDLCSNAHNGKDIRLYHMQKMIINSMKNNKTNVNYVWEKFSNKSIIYSSISILLQLLITFAALSFTGLKAYYGFILIGSVVSGSAAITLLGHGIIDLIYTIQQQLLCANYLSKYFTFMDLKSKTVYGDKQIDLSKPINIEFKHVNFAYPHQTKNVLEDVNLKINANEKLAIVGLNGSGKTTFVKLLTRLYEPCSGEILINGININKYNEESCYKLYSVVFQDFKLVSFSIKENIWANYYGDNELAIESLKKAGIYDRIMQFPNKLDTILYQDSEENGVEISGGEAQKIAIARALYKNSPVVILDEPTSALDPKSEAEIYEKFSSLVNGKTSIFISHRMSSTKFCDCIIVFDKGHIIENGNHESLLNDNNSFYKKMWDAQAQYYR